MALLLKEKLTSGFEAEYWRIVSINHQSRGITVVILGLFLDQFISDDGMMLSEQFEFLIPKEVYTLGNCYEWIYEQIKTTEKFATSVDC